MRRQLELVHRQGEHARDALTVLAPDYTLTLGKMEKALGVIAVRLEAVEGQPALKMTGTDWRAEINRGAREVTNRMDATLSEPVREIRAATAKMEDLIGTARSQADQKNWLRTAAIGGAMIGALLWVLLAAVLPWGVGDWIAALPISGGDPWKAGGTLLSRSSPRDWEKMAKLFNACGDQSTELCEAAIAVRTIPPMGQEGKASPAPPILTARPPPRARPVQ